MAEIRYCVYKKHSVTLPAEIITKVILTQNQKNMKTGILLSVASLFITIVAMASPITETEAQQKASDFMSDRKSNGKILQSKAIIADTPKFITAESCDAFYVFNNETSGGYVIVSADDRMPAVLGYSYTGTFKSDEIPENMRAWLNGYVEEYEFMLEHDDATAVSTTSVTGEKIYPLLTTKWNQSYPYNAKCPTIDGSHAPTGCVATAMAQIMYYHQWPKQTTKTIPSYTTYTNKIIVPSIGVTAIDWDNMFLTYSDDRYSDGSNVMYSAEQVEAISTLFNLCGTSIEMDYEAGGSGASTIAAKEALVNYFGYESSSISYKQRSSYSLSNWNQIIYDEIKENRPVMYSGNDQFGGHAFIIDGYDKDDYFHVNWGWSGNDDNYFLLNSLNGYNNSQSAIIGICSPESIEHRYPYAVYENNTLTFYYDNKREEKQETIYANIFTSYNIEQHKYLPDWYSNTPYITSINFDSSFYEFKKLSSTEKWFMDMTELVSIQGLEYIDTKPVMSMSRMFYNCRSLTNLNLSTFDTQNVMDMSEMFYGCTNLTSLNLNDFDTKNVTDMSFMFDGCSNLRTLDLSSFNTQNVTDMSFMFFEDTSLETLDVSNFNTKNVTNMRGMFRTCSKLTNLDLKNFNAQNATNIRGMFFDCSSLTSLNLSNFDTRNVTDMSSLFYECNKLTSLNLSGFNTQNVEKMPNMFYGCNSLTSLDLSSFDTKKVTDMRKMFYKCSALTKVDLSSFNTQNVQYMEYMFSDCSSLTSLDVSKFDTRNVRTMKSMFYECSSLTNLDLSSFNTQKVINMSHMFSYCSGLISLDISSFDTQDVYYMNSMFSGCSGLTSLDVSNFNTQNVENMSYIFFNCSSLTSLDVSKFDTKNVKDMSGMFESCSSLTSLDVSKFDTKNVENMSYMFYYCTNLASLEVSSFNTQNVTDMILMFFYCSSLTSLDVSKFNTQNVTNMSGMFRNCSNLSSLDLRNFNTGKANDMKYMFTSNYRLKTIYVGDNWTTSNVTESTGMFLYCYDIIGQDGTKYNSDYTDVTKAHYGTGGYLTYRDPSAINSVKGNMSGSLTRKYYSIDGKRLSQPQKGLNILRMGDGTTKKIMR
ncbi:MAG: BspA family leucine-rich repeat surface protein [Prevotella sp.]|nr:BspA family leucine-rich repeat surface protein [Prevotella sp.]